MRHYMTTVSGRQLVFEHPESAQITIEDIAHHLSHICHWNGACTTFYSVAQHCVYVSDLVPPHLARWALLHDAAEAYVGDMTRGLKMMLPDFKTIETRVLRAIATTFDLPWPEPPKLKTYDNFALQAEAHNFMPRDIQLTRNDGTPMPIVYTDRLTAWSPASARLSFLARFYELWPDWRTA